MSILTGIKLGLIAFLCLWAYHLGGDAAREKAEAAQVALAKASVAALEQGARKLQSVENAYDAIKDIPDPVAISAGRLLIAACDLPSPDPVADGAHPTRAQPSGPAGITGGVAASLDRYIQACSADAKQLNAVVELASQK